MLQRMVHGDAIVLAIMAVQFAANERDARRPPAFACLRQKGVDPGQVRKTELGQFLEPCAFPASHIKDRRIECQPRYRRNPWLGSAADAIGYPLSAWKGLRVANQSNRHPSLEQVLPDRIFAAIIEGVVGLAGLEAPKVFGDVRDLQCPARTATEVLKRLAGPEHHLARCDPFRDFVSAANPARHRLAIVDTPRGRRILCVRLLGLASGVEPRFAMLDILAQPQRETTQKQKANQKDDGEEHRLTTTSPA